MPNGQEAGGDASGPEPQRIVDSAATVMSTEPRWGYLRLMTVSGCFEFRITDVCAEDLIIDMQNFLAATAPSHA